MNRREVARCRWFLVLSMVLSMGYGQGQVVFWSETFDNCGSGVLPRTCPTGSWTEALISAAPGNGGQANRWYISCDECGPAAGSCGDMCGFGSCSALPTDATLHVTAPSSLWGMVCMGACYYDGSLDPWTLTCLADGSNTHKRVISPLIDATGKSGIYVRFNYIMNGSATDYARVYYSVDGGTTWTLLFTPSANTCPSGQGRWQSSGWLALPASADNNPNLRLSVVWRNDGNCDGVDPSFAIDDIEVGATVFPLRRTQITAHWLGDGKVEVNIEVEPAHQVTSVELYWWTEEQPQEKQKVALLEVDREGRAVFVHGGASPQSVNYYQAKTYMNDGTYQYSNIAMAYNPHHTQPSVPRIVSHWQRGTQLVLRAVGLDPMKRYVLVIFDHDGRVLRTVPLSSLAPPATGNNGHGETILVLSAEQLGKDGIILISIAPAGMGTELYSATELAGLPVYRAVITH